MQSSVDLIKGKLNIKDVVGSYIKLEKTGVNYRAKCPFHNERTPSFFVSPGRETFHCFGCAKGGDMFSFVEEIEGVEFREALKILADRAGVTLEQFQGSKQTASTGGLRDVMLEAVKFYQNELEKADVAKAYLKERGVSEISAQTFKIGFAPSGWRNLTAHLKTMGFKPEDTEHAGLIIKSPKSEGDYYDRFRGRLMFPFFDYSGRPIAFSARILNGVTDDKQGKYINSPETPLFHKSRTFYGVEQAKQSIRELDKTLLVEGQLDVIMANQSGTKNVLGVSGTALTLEHIDLIKRLSDNLVIILDADEAGFRASERSVRLALSRGMYVSVVTLPTGKDPADCVREDKKIWHEALTKEKPFIDYALENISKLSSSTKDTHNKIQEYLYPHLINMYNEIEKDKILQKIATLMQVSHDATNKDFQKWLASYNTGKAGEKMAPRTGEELIKNRKFSGGIKIVARRLFAILAFLEHKGKVGLAENLKEKLKLVPSELSPSESIDELLFEAEVFYPEGTNIENEIEMLEKRLSGELLRYEFEDAMYMLRKAEESGNEKLAGEWLAKCQEISKRIKS